MDKVNELIKRNFAEILHEEAERPVGVMITVARVDTTPNLKSSTVWLYIFPLERAEEALAMLKNQMYDLQGSLNRTLHMRPLPRITLKLDTGSAHAQQIEQRLEELEHEDSPDDSA